MSLPDVEESPVTNSSPALSLQNTIFVPDTLRVGVLLAQGFEGPGVSKLAEQLTAAKLRVVFEHDTLGMVNGTEGVTYEVHDSFLTRSPLGYDGIVIVGSGSITPYFTNTAQKFTTDIYNHFKPIGIVQNGGAVLESLGLNRPSFLNPAMV